MALYLWLDDLRAAPPGWHHARTVAEAVVAIQSVGPCEKASLDHDLGCIGPAAGCPACQPGALRDTLHIDAPNGKAFVIWIIEQNRWPKEKPTVHSQNPVGRETMEGLIDRYGPY